MNIVVCDLSTVSTVNSVGKETANRRARFAGRNIPRYTEHQTVLPAPEAPFSVLIGICRMARLNYYGEFRDYFGVPRDPPTLRIERACSVM